MEEYNCTLIKGSSFLWVAKGAEDQYSSGEIC
jgi:hypothetical protein